MKKYFWMLLAAMTLSLGFTACGDDDDPEPKKDDPTQQDNPQNPDQVIKFEDYASTIGMTLQQMLQKHGEPDMQFGNYYSYSFKSGNVENLTIIVNPANNKVSGIMEMLNAKAYTAEQLKAYFDKNYKFYTREVIPANEEEETPEMVTLIYGDKEKMEEATLIVSVTDNTLVTYADPNNQPEEESVEALFDEMNPIDVMDAFLGEPLADVLEDYEDAFMEMGTMYYAPCEDNEWMTAFSLMANEQGTVYSITFFFDDGLEESVILDFFKENGWTVTEAGVIEDEDEDRTIQTYSISKVNVIITYADYMATAVWVSAEDL